jgi:hypothetical protein
MEERTETNGQNQSASSTDPDLVARLYEKIARLHASLQALRRTSEDLEADRQRLLEENRNLRRRITVSTLVEDLERSIASRDAEGPDEVVPPPAERLYRALPSRFSFPHFFQAANDERLDTRTARRCLAHYLANGALVQTGAYLEKTGRFLDEAGD